MGAHFGRGVACALISKQTAASFGDKGVFLLVSALWERDAFCTTASIKIKKFKKHGSRVCLKTFGNTGEI